MAGGDGSGREIITLQLGHYSNFVGAHFWNSQEANVASAASHERPEIESAVLYRQGFLGNSKEASLNPRLVAVDLKGAHGLLPVRGGGVYDEDAESHRPDAAESQLWTGDTTVSQQDSREGERGLLRKLLEWSRKDTPPESTSSGQQELDGRVDVWSDFLMSRFHPRSNVVVDDYQHGCSLHPFDVYSLGYRHDRLCEEVEDGVRFYAEEADGLRGFHLILDTKDGFGGVGSRTAQLLRDEYSSKCQVAFPCFGGRERYVAADVKEADLVLGNFLNTALAISGLSDACDLVTPISTLPTFFPFKGGSRTFSGLNYRPDLDYHTSSILASAIDTATSPWRSRQRIHEEMISFCSALNGGGRKLAGLAIALPLAIDQRERSLAQLLKRLEAVEGNGTKLLGACTSVTPECEVALSEVYAQALSFRGLCDDRLPGSYSMEERHAEVEATLYRHTENWRGMNVVHASSISDPVSRPFPNIMAGNFGTFFSNSAPVLTSWQSSQSGAGNMATLLAERTSKINLKKFHRFQEAGLECDELSETVERLFALSECYEHRSGPV